MQTICDLHSLALTGPTGHRLVEVVAGCLCLLALCLTAPLGTARMVAGLMLSLGLLLSLTGLSLLAALADKWLAGRMRRS